MYLDIEDLSKIPKRTLMLKDNFDIEFERIKKECEQARVEIEADRRKMNVDRERIDREFNRIKTSVELEFAINALINNEYLNRKEKELFGK